MTDIPTQLEQLNQRALEGGGAARVKQHLDTKQDADHTEKVDPNCKSVQK